METPSGASQRQAPYAFAATAPDMKMRSGVGRATSAAAQGPGSDRNEHPLTFMSGLNDQPLTSVVVSADTVYVPASAPGAALRARATAAVQATARSRARSMCGP